MTYIARDDDRLNYVRSDTFNFDNGAGATIDDVVLLLDKPIEIVSARVVYEEATDTSGAASANVKIGTAAGGDQIVAATAYGTSKAVGSYTTLTVKDSGKFVPANTAVFVRHTGIAATEGGQGYVQICYRFRNL